MLVITVIVSGAGCALLAAYALLSYCCKQRLAAVQDAVTEQRDSKARHAEKLDGALARAIAEGKRPTGELVDTWQTRRAEILTSSKAERPWAWSEEDLGTWARERTATQTEAIKRRTLVTLALTALLLVVIAGSACAVYYANYAAQQAAPIGALVPEELTPLPADAAPTSATPPSQAAAAAVKTNPATVPGPQPTPPSPNPQTNK